MFNSDHFVIAYYKQEMRQSLSQRTLNENNQFKETKTWISNAYDQTKLLNVPCKWCIVIIVLTQIKETRGIFGNFIELKHRK